MPGSMTPQQFQVVAKLLRSKPGQVQEAARKVLVDGATNTEAREDNPDISAQSVSQIVRRFQAAHKLILSAYGPVPIPGLGNEENL